MESDNFKIDFVIKPSANNDSTNYNIRSLNNPWAQNSSKGYLYIPSVTTPTTPVSTGNIGGGTGFEREELVALLVDLSTTIEQITQSNNEKEIDVKIELLNTAKDVIAGEIAYGLRSPDGEVFSKVTKKFTSDPSCSVGIFDEPRGVCFGRVGPSGSLADYGPSTLVFDDLLILPAKAKIGEWSIFVDISAVEEVFSTSEKFEVSRDFIGYFMGVSIIVLFALFFFDRRKFPFRR